MTRSFIVALVAALGVAAMSRAASASETVTPRVQRWVPTVSLVMGSFDERLRVRVDGTDYDSYRSQLRTFLAVGLAHPILRSSSDRAWIDGHASVGLGPTFQSGDWNVPLREDLTLAVAAAGWLTLRAGLGLGVTIDATAASRSFGEIGLPIGLTFWRAIELLYRPMLSIPLGRESSAVFGGQRELATRLALLPFEVGVRVRIEALAW